MSFFLNTRVFFFFSFFNHFLFASQTCASLASVVCFPTSRWHHMPGDSRSQLSQQSGYSYTCKCLYTCITVRVSVCARRGRQKDVCDIAQRGTVMHLGINCESNDASQKNLWSKLKIHGGGGRRGGVGWCDGSVAMHTECFVLTPTQRANEADMSRVSAASAITASKEAPV